MDKRTNPVSTMTGFIDPGSFPVTSIFKEFHLQQVPSWFFGDSYIATFSMYDVPTDVRLVQTSALNEDCQRLRRNYPVSSL